MGEVNYLVLEFTKSDGDKYSLKISYPTVPAEGADVKALGDFIVTNSVFSFSDGSTISSFDAAMIQTVTETAISLA